MGGDAAFYVCPPDYSIANPGSDQRILRWMLTGAAKSSNGRTVFSDPNGIAQVVLQNGWAFGATGDGGVTVKGSIAAGSIVVIAYAPTPTAIRGFAVWKLAHSTTELSATTTHHGSNAQLVAGGIRRGPKLVIDPSHVVHDIALKQLFARDMRHLEQIADGNDTGACAFYQSGRGGQDDTSCAQAIGLSGQHPAIEASIRTATFMSYNGYTFARSQIGDQPLGWILEQDHFRIEV